MTAIVVSSFIFLRRHDVCRPDGTRQPLAGADCYLLPVCDAKWSWHEAQIWALPGCS
jgi:hypothetical protein